VRRSRGFSLIEIVVALTIFGVVILMFVMLEAEYFRFDRKARLEFFAHPENRAVMTRLRNDVLDSASYPFSFSTWTQSPQTLILEMPSEEGRGPLRVVWDFSEEGHVRRREFESASETSSWLARGTPRYEISGTGMPDGDVALRLKGFDSRGRLVVDQIVARRR
jgi:prepilin-type N-terminal cleavage/methylation domain-containing protein